MPPFLTAYLATLIIAVLATYAVKNAAYYFKILDKPTLERKIHGKPIPLMGGLAIFLSLVIVSLYYSAIDNQLVQGYLSFKHLLGVFLGGLIITIGGILDDRYDLPPIKQIIFPILAVFAVIATGIGIESISNPIAGGYFTLDQIKIQLFTYGGIPYFLTLFADLFTFIWLMGMMYTTKYLDGLDGLVGGVSLIAAVIIFFVARNVTLQQDYIALLAIIFAGALSGFLLFNFNPASIFLGESGSLFAGFMIGCLAILSGSKIATALLVFGIPIFDVIWVISRRFITRQPLTKGDKQHLHHRLLAVGLTQRQAVLLMYGLTLIFGLAAIYLQTIYKLYVLGALVAFMIAFAFLLVHFYNRKIKHV